MRVRSVTVNGAYKGEIYYQNNRWWYVRKNGGVTSFHSEYEVKKYVARVCNEAIDGVKFEKRS